MNSFIEVFLLLYSLLLTFLLIYFYSIYKKVTGNVKTVGGILDDFLGTSQLNPGEVKS